MRINFFAAPMRAKRHAAFRRSRMRVAAVGSRTVRSKAQVSGYDAMMSCAVLRKSAFLEGLATCMSGNLLFVY